MMTVMLCMQFGALSVFVVQVMLVVSEVWCLILYQGYLSTFPLIYIIDILDCSSCYELYSLHVNVGVGDPHCIIFHLPGGSSHMLKALIRHSNSSTMTVIIPDCVREEMRREQH